MAIFLSIIIGITIFILIILVYLFFPKKPKSIIDIARKYAIACHSSVNQKYDGHNYIYHINMVVEYAKKYSYLLPPEKVDVVIAGAYVHDTIEDCRQTYNDVKKVLNIDVADLAYALTTEKGRTRKERANSKYYEGIRNTPYATYIKLCDRLANVSYSKQKGSGMYKAYKREHKQFKNELYSIEYQPMWDELNSILNI